MEYKIIDTKDFSTAKNQTQSYGILVNNNNEVLLVSKDNLEWSLPGGTIEKEEDPVNTLIREVYEEAAVKLDLESITPFFYQEVHFDDSNEPLITQLRYFAKIKAIDNFEGDPGGLVKYQKFVSIDDLDKFLLWGDTTKFIMNKLEKLLK